MKGLTLCADDYSQSAAINRAILKLLDHGRINAVSCLTQSFSWHRDARNLASAGAPQVGLHFNLTLPLGIPERRVSTVMAASMIGKLDRCWIRQAFESQWQEFVRHFGRPPDFVDGHQHVHVFPIIRDIIVDHLANNDARCWVRTLNPLPDLPSGPFKQQLLQRLGKPLQSRLDEAGIPTNSGFAGFRSYRKPHQFRKQFRSWLGSHREGTLIMCHPGLTSTDPSDPIRDSRIEEFHYLASDLYKSDCADFRLPLAAECHT